MVTVRGQNNFFPRISREPEVQTNLALPCHCIVSTPRATGRDLRQFLSAALRFETRTSVKRLKKWAKALRLPLLLVHPFHSAPCAMSGAADATDPTPLSSLIYPPPPFPWPSQNSSHVTLTTLAGGIEGDADAAPSLTYNVSLSLHESDGLSIKMSPLTGEMLYMQEYGVLEAEEVTAGCGNWKR